MTVPVTLLERRRSGQTPAVASSGSSAVLARREGRVEVSSVELASLHALTWLVVANAVGLLLATLLLAPELGRALGPMTYGRWVPVHLDLQLYGWCALPLVALLLRAYGAEGSRGEGRWAVHVWSVSLILAAATWLGGSSSGKLFLEWTGAARLAFPSSLGLLALTLGRLWLVTSDGRSEPRTAHAARRKVLLGALWLALLPVPPILYWASGPGVYPSFNPDSGGATGTSLMGSTLGIVLVLCLAPLLAGLELREPRVLRQTLALFAAHFVVFLALDHGPHSHHEPLEIAALASLLLWLPLVVRLYRRVSWPTAARPWLAALAGWSAILLLTAFVSFLPGVLEALKFTDALVAHAHLAMGAVLSSFAVVLLVSVNRDTRLDRTFTSRRAYWSWHGGAALLIVSLAVLGVAEGLAAQGPSRPDALVDALYAVRWVAGGLMLVASAEWLGSGVRALARPRRRCVLDGGPS